MYGRPSTVSPADSINRESLVAAHLLPAIRAARQRCRSLDNRPDNGYGLNPLAQGIWRYNRGIEVIETMWP
jgi:hypothetical protein